MIVRPVTLEGWGVRLEPLTVAHTDALWAAQDWDTWRWTLKQPRSRDDYAEIVAAAVAATEAGRELAWATLLHDVPVGSTRYLNPSDWDSRVEIGHTWLGPAARGTRVNPTAKLLQLTHAFETLGCVRVELKTDGRNQRSQRAMERLGAVYEGRFRDHRRVSTGEVFDTVWYAILAREWPSVKARLLERIGG